MWWLTLLACSSDPRLADGWPDAPPEGAVPAMRGFSWLEPGVLAGMPWPSATDLHFVADQGVELLVTLTESPLSPDALDSAGLDTLHLPIRDFHAPTMDQMLAFTEAVEARALAGSPVGVHCLVGLGRTGTLAAVWAVHTGSSPDDAIASVRAARPGSIETPAQEQAVHDYAAWLAGE